MRFQPVDAVGSRLDRAIVFARTLPGDVQRRGRPLLFAHGAGAHRPGDRFQLRLVAAQQVGVEESLRDAAVGNCASCRLRRLPGGSHGRRRRDDRCVVDGACLCITIPLALRQVNRSAPLVVHGELSEAWQRNCVRMYSMLASTSHGSPN